ncbi:MAG TPA: D-inositol-3-phosphate glycosyltransferase [Mycobacteriales bacterium]|jgi:D-inositol-3-phosphate glycosyltransferase|nr:D-inositol-3-phosphate glycosyltransferase [Mycobacteriales bacterium]
MTSAGSAESAQQPRRVALLSVHTSPLEQPGAQDAGGLNVYVVETARGLAARGIEVEIFTRAGASDLPPVVEMEPGVLVRHVAAGPFGSLSTRELPPQLCAFSAGLLAAWAGHEPDWFDVIHSHYWLSGYVGRGARDRWGVPLVHSAHTLAKVKNLHRGPGEAAEPAVRILGEERIVADADRLIAPTQREADELIQLYDADPADVAVVPPGVNLKAFSPGDQAAARAELGLPADGVLLVFVGRIQPHKAPDLLIRAAALLPELAGRLTVAIVGGASGHGYADGTLPALVRELGLTDAVRFVPPVSRTALAAVYRAADVMVMPSRSESFGLAALEAQACGTPVVATPVGGLPQAVDDEVSGLLTEGHEPAQIAAAIRRIVTDPELAARLGRGGIAHAREHSWDRTVDGLLEAYAEARRRPRLADETLAR